MYRYEIVRLIIPLSNITIKLNFCFNPQIDIHNSMTAFPFNVEKNSGFYFIYLIIDVKCFIFKLDYTGEVSERLKEHAWKACERETAPRVRIPPSPPQ